MLAALQSHLCSHGQRWVCASAAGWVTRGDMPGGTLVASGPELVCGAGVGGGNRRSCPLSLGHGHEVSVRPISHRSASLSPMVSCLYRHL